MTEIHRLHLTNVTPAPHLPWARPTFPVFAHLVLHPTGPILIDTGVGVGHAFIDELYSPVHHDLDEALARHGVAVGDITTIITSHLHFDHCGQNHRFRGARVIVQHSEFEAAQAPLYTVPEWAFPEGIDLTAIEGDQEIAAGVRVVSTPGHTPGHQSVLIEGAAEGTTIICCQASWNVLSFGEATLGDDGWDQTTGAASLEKLHALRPQRVLFSHDAQQWSPPT